MAGRSAPDGLAALGRLAAWALWGTLAVIAAAAVVIAAAAALTVRCVRGVPAGLARFERTWAAAALSWGLLLAVLGAVLSALGEHAERDPRGESSALGAALIFLLAFTALGVIRIWARRLGQREVRESGLRGFNPQLRGTGEARPSPVSNAASISELRRDVAELQEWRAEQETWTAEVERRAEVNVPKLEAMAEIVRAAHEQEGVEVPPELQVSRPTMPLPVLRLIWDARRERGA